MVCSCAHLRKERGKDIVAECCGKILTMGEIDQLTHGFTGEDSARMAEEYIQHWAIELLMYEYSHRVSSRRIEELVEDYRRSLYVYEFEQLLVSQRMSQDVADSLLLSFYDSHKHELLLREMILRGVLVIVPKDAPNLTDLRRYLGHLDDSESLEWLEKYVYQYAVGYELFVDNWKLCDEVLSFLPVEKREFDNLLRKDTHVELEDSLNAYFLEVLEFYPSGSVMPFDYARLDIEKNILGIRRVEFLDSMRIELYDKSLKNGKLKRYEN
jgi:hypothetical protein